MKVYHNYGTPVLGLTMYSDKFWRKYRILILMSFYWHTFTVCNINIHLKEEMHIFNISWVILICSFLLFIIICFMVHVCDVKWLSLSWVVGIWTTHLKIFKSFSTPFPYFPSFDFLIFKYKKIHAFEKCPNYW